MSFNNPLILSKILENIPNYVFWKDANFVYQGCNLNFLKFVGCKDFDDLIGRTDYDLPWGKYTADIYRQEDRQILESGNSIVSKEVPMLWANADEEKILYISKAPLRDHEQRIIGVLGVYIDITKQKKLESQLKTALKAKSEFIANISHDIRTPIAGMVGMVQDLINAADHTESSLHTSEKDCLLQNIIQTVRHDGYYLMAATGELLQFCNEIIEIVSLESPNPKDRSESFRLYDLLKHNIDLLGPVAHHKKLHLSYKIDQNVPPYLNGFRVYLDRVLLNLISNALKFTEKGSVKVFVRTLSHNDVDDWKIGEKINIQIIIEDTGIGIPDDKFETIFEHFSRLMASYEGLYRGSGLGLYTVKHYVEVMNGKIELKSTVNKGTTFTVTLPFTISDHSDRPNESISSLQTRDTFVQFPGEKNLEVKNLQEGDHFASILVVEDNDLAAMALKIALRPFKCAIDIAKNGGQAVTMAERGDYDLIFMDIGLPDFSGIEAAKKIRVLADSKKSAVPIVGLTGHAANTAMRQKSLCAGMQEVLSKPAEPLVLESVFNRFIFEWPEKVGCVESTQESEMELHAAIDWDACVRMCGGDANFARELLSMLIEDLKKTKALLTKAFENQDIRALLAELHRTRGGVCYLKLPQLEYALIAFHEAVKAAPRDSGRVKQTYIDLQKAIDKFRMVWEKGEF